MTIFWQRPSRKLLNLIYLINPFLWVLKRAFFSFGMNNVENIFVLKIFVGYSYYLLIVPILNYAFAKIQNFFHYQADNRWVPAKVTIK